MRAAADPSAPLEPTTEVLSALERYLQLLEGGNAPTPEDFVARHPNIEGPLRACLASLNFLHGAAGGFRAASSHEPGSETSPEPLAPESRTLGDFRLVREVGRGGMGVVYEAEQLSLGRRVALKVLPFAGTLDPRQLQRFRHEAQIAACLHHGHIVPVHAVGCDRGVHYFAMQFIEGQSLADIIRHLRQERGLEPAGDGETAARADTAPTPPGRSCPRAVFESAARMIASAAEALEHAHSLGVVHRDVKPGNLLLDQSGHLWVTDFGLAQAHADPRLTLSGDIVGTLRYMPPEQARGGALPADPRGDVYGLGVTLFELVTLQPAFGAHPRRELLRQVAHDEPTAPRRIDPDIPAELETIILKAMAKSPHDRYPTARELREDLERWLADRPIRARRPTLLQQAARFVRKHRGAAWTAAAAGVLLLVGLAGWAWREAHLADGRARDAEARRGELEEALGREHVQRNRAEGRTAQTLALLDTLYLRLAEDRLPRSPEAIEEEQGFLAGALAAYERVLTDDPGESARPEEAIARCRVGLLQSRLGMLAESARTLREALARLEGLPESRRLLEARVTCLLKLAELARAGGEADEADTLFRKASAIEGAVGAHLRGRVAWSHALALEQSGRIAEAERKLNTARRELESTEEGATDLAAVLHQQGLLRRAASGPGAGLPLLEEAVRHARPRQGEATARQMLALSLSAISEEKRLSGDLPGAARAAAAAVAEARALAWAWPGVPGYRRLEAQALGEQARILAQQGDEKAAPLLRSARALARELVALGERSVKKWPGTRTHRAALAEDAGLLAALLLMGGGSEREALPRCRQAVAEYRALCKVQPGFVKWQEELAGGLGNLSLCLERLNRPKEAITEMEACRDAWNTLPTSPTRQAWVARAWLRLGVLRRRAVSDRSAEAAYQEALALYRPLVDSSTCPAILRGEFGQACNNLANILLVARKDNEADTLYADAEAAGAWMAAHCPGDIECRTLRLYPTLLRGRIAARAGRPADAYHAIATLPARVPDLSDAHFRSAEMLMTIRAELLAGMACSSLKRGLSRRIEETAIRLLTNGRLPPGALSMDIFLPLHGHPGFEALLARPAL